MSYEISYGAKYEKGLDVAEIAARIRTDIKAAVKAGELPNLTASVTIERYSGGRSIRVKITKFAGPIMNVSRAFLDGRGRLDFDLEGPSEEFNGRYVRPSYLSNEIRDAVSKLEAIVAAYNYDGSDIMSDYFNVNFYGSCGVGHDLEQSARVELQAALDLAGWVAGQVAA